MSKLMFGLAAAVALLGGQVQAQQLAKKAPTATVAPLSIVDQDGKYVGRYFPTEPVPSLIVEVDGILARALVAPGTPIPGIFIKRLPIFSRTANCSAPWYFQTEPSSPPPGIREAGVRVYPGFHLFFVADEDQSNLPSGTEPGWYELDTFGSCRPVAQAVFKYRSSLMRDYNFHTPLQVR